MRIIRKLRCALRAQTTVPTWVGYCVAFLLLSCGFMFLWNYLIIWLIPLPAIDFWRSLTALGISIFLLICKREIDRP